MQASDMMMDCGKVQVVVEEQGCVHIDAMVVDCMLGLPIVI